MCELHDLTGRSIKGCEGAILVRRFESWLRLTNEPTMFFFNVQNFSNLGKEHQSLSCTMDFDDCAKKSGYVVDNYLWLISYTARRQCPTVDHRN